MHPKRKELQEKRERERKIRAVVGPILLCAVIVFALIGLVASAVNTPADQEATPTPCPGGSCEPLPTQSQGCENSRPGKNPHCPTATTVIVPTPEVATSTPTRVRPTATNTRVPATATNTSVPATATNTPKPGDPTATPTREDGEIVTIMPTATLSPTKTFVFDPPPPADTCDLCNAQEEALHAEARWKNTLSDFLSAILDGEVPELFKLWLERE